MQTTSSYSDYQPLGHWGRVPIHITTIMTALMVLGLVVYAILASAGGSPAETFGFLPGRFGRGYIWTPLTYPFMDKPGFFSLFGLFVYYSWGIQVEQFLGRSRYVIFTLAIVLLQPLIATAWYVAGVPAGALGNLMVTAALLIAFATIYPNIEYLGWVPLKWIAFACIAIGSLMYFSERNWVELSLLWGSCAASFGFIRYLQNGGAMELPDFSRLNPFKRRPKFRVVPSPSAPRRSATVEEEDTAAEMDALLDKIAKSGMSSLTARERARLEKAREALMKKDRR